MCVLGRQSVAHGRSGHTVLGLDLDVRRVTGELYLDTGILRVYYTGRRIGFVKPFSTFFASHRRSRCEPQRLRTACRAPATGLPAAQPHSLRRQLVGSAWTRARRDGNPTHGASTRLRFCNKVCLACAGDAQSSRDDAGSLGSTSKHEGGSRGQKPVCALFVGGSQ